MRPLLFSLAVLTAAGLRAQRDPRAFHADREEIRVLAVERVRQAPNDYQRVLATAENRLSVLHENYQVAGGTPPTRLNGDIADLRGRCQDVWRRRSAGRPVDLEPAAAPAIERRWKSHQGAFDRLLEEIETLARDKTPESQIYWRALKGFERLGRETERALMFNTPPEGANLAKALEDQEAALLKACERTPRRTRRANARVIVPAQYAFASEINVQAFYRFLDKVTQTPAKKSGAFAVPVGARTVTQRENGLRLVVRPVRGNGVAYIGTMEQELGYDYLTFPADTAYYFENTGTTPLEIEYVGLEDQ
ncbi:MAG: hypothetical protein KA044_04675 [Elusimicrobia bacterium]|nr:hypothetical protein [Elusimicrobiota bacterium]